MLSSYVPSASRHFQNAIYDSSNKHIQTKKFPCIFPPSQQISKKLHSSKKVSLSRRNGIGIKTWKRLDALEFREECFCVSNSILKDLQY